MNKTSLVGSRSPTDLPHRRGIRAFSLLEVMVATTVLGIAITMTLGVYVLAIKRTTHAENMLSGTAELRYASDYISQAVRSSTQPPVVTTGGLQLLLPPDDLPWLVVQQGTWIDSANTVRGWKTNQRTLKVLAEVRAAPQQVFNGASRPAGQVATTDVASYFNASATAVPYVRDILSVGDTVSIPATAFGAAIPSLTVNSVSNNPNPPETTVTFTNNLGQDVPDGAHVLITSGQRLLFAVVTVTGGSTELRYYRDSRDTTKYKVLATDIDPAPLLNPAASAGGRTVPFVLGTNNDVTINLQKIPRGTSAGRTLQGLRTTVYARTNPAIE